jgi:hypothetical protein
VAAFLKVCDCFCIYRWTDFVQYNQACVRSSRWQGALVFVLGRSPLCQRLELELILAQGRSLSLSVRSPSVKAHCGAMMRALSPAVGPLAAPCITHARHPSGHLVVPCHTRVCSLPSPCGGSTLTGYLYPVEFPHGAMSRPCLSLPLAPGSNASRFAVAAL